jgi:uncharacterized protein YciI
MKKFLCCVLGSFLLMPAMFAQENIYDSVLAKKLGADKYGMKQYVMVILTTGPATGVDKKTSDSLFAGHMSNMGVLAKDNRLVVAGPFGKNDLKYRGIFVFNTNSIDDAKAWVATDPAIRGGLLDAVFINWYCSAALMQVNETHPKLQKSSF